MTITCARRFSCGLRDDVDPQTVRRTEPGRAPDVAPTGPIDDIVAQLASTKNALTLAVGPHQIRVTNLDRVYWPANPASKQPALTKRDLLRYVAQISPYMLPHLADRPLTMIRMPDGIRGQRFFQKHWEQARPAFVETITVFSGTKEESHTYLLCNNLPTLLWLAQSGTLEYHIWHSRAKPGSDAVTDSTDYAASLESLEASVLNYPDYVLFDLDPYIYSGKEAKGAEPELNTVAFEKARKWRSGCASSCRACRSSPSSRPRGRPACTCSCRSGARSISTLPAMYRSSWAGT
jgi:bifunctional non-homologous end joining protein LigD